MKAHSMRRSLWILSVALGAGVVGLAAWFVLDVKKEVEAVPKVSPKRIAQAKDPKKLDKTHRDIKTVLDTSGSKVKQVV